MSQHSIQKVYVQAENGVPCDEAFFKAWDGFRRRGVPCELFESARLIDGELPVSRDTLIAGAIRVVEHALRQIGIAVPPADNLPECLAEYRGRRVRRSTWAALQAEVADRGLVEPLFVKPAVRNKGFPSIAVFSKDDVDGHPLGANDEVLIAEYVMFASEWRCFVCRGDVLEVCHYQGDPFSFPDAVVMRDAISVFSPWAPAGYGIDFGVLDDGRTVLVEVNEGYSLGSYGVNSVEYAGLLEARWLELTAV